MFDLAVPDQMSGWAVFGLEERSELDGEPACPTDDEGCIRTRILPSSEGEASNETSSPPRPASAGVSTSVNWSLRVMGMGTEPDLMRRRSSLSISIPEWVLARVQS